MRKDKNGREFLDYEEAVAMLPEGDKIHTFLNPGAGMLIGADWSRSKILEALVKGKPELSGAEATKMHHGMLVTRPDGEFMFIETKVEADEGDA